MSVAEPIVRFKNVQKSYDDETLVVKNLNLAIAKGGRIDFQPEWFDVSSDATPDGSKPAPAANLA